MDHDPSVSEKTKPFDHTPDGGFKLLCLGALGVVFGDIGTSPLYAVRECFYGAHAIPLTNANIFGVLSLIFWSLTMVISIKYLLYVTRADNHGEGGILALMSVVRTRLKGGKRTWIVTGIGLFGASLLYGDGMLTPAISVLSAVEGLEVATPVFKSMVVPITVAILTGLFFIQRRGTSDIGKLFGPVMCVWFAVLAALGVSSIVQTPSVIAAFNPLHAVDYFLRNGREGFFVLGAVFLVVTGGEALYADLGHFSAKPIRFTWFLLAGPALVLNYFGQGALLLRNPAAAVNPFYNMCPEWALYPMVGLATFATVIASQAVISGVFSLTRQAVQLGYLPRMTIVHTSKDRIGEIYIPFANWALFAATTALVISFGSSSALASAYGIAVSLDMVITTILACLVAIFVWGWSPWLAGGLTALFLVIDLAFLGANFAKIVEGGYVPLIAAAAAVLVFTTWQRGQRALQSLEIEGRLPIKTFIGDSGPSGVTRVPGDAVFLSPDPEGTPISLLHNVKHNKVLHRRNIMLSVVTEPIPRVPSLERVEYEDLGNDFHRLVLRFGFKEVPNLETALDVAAEKGLKLNPMTTTFFLTRNTVLTEGGKRMPRWRAAIYHFLYTNELRPALYYNLPPNRVVEIGRQIVL
ncbi:MAG: potassium transporter Kup [Elusimicrobia bacterium]|nr:MAG: potassium transporter Kup [Elusimicrobiota bacterium]